MSISSVQPASDSSTDISALEAVKPRKLVTKLRELVPDRLPGHPFAEAVEEAAPFGHVGDTPPPAIVGVD